MKKKYLLLLFPIFIWLMSLAKCEIATLLYGEEFEGEFDQTNMIAGNPEPKVLKYSNQEATIYYVDDSGGDIIIFEKVNDEWIMKEWARTVWAKGGSADGFVWPYGR